MRKLAYSTDISRPLAEVYALASQVERQPEFMSDYLSCRILERQPERLLLERTAKIHGKIVAWQSWVSFRENEGLYFTHKGGRLDGMQVTWRFSSQDAHHTRMTITQTFHISHPLPWIGAFMERWVFGPKLSDIAQRVIQSFKRACEAPVEALT
jgi:ribosome-associated toxin RatA of RatAB toxin-antitoxin module